MKYFYVLFPISINNKASPPHWAKLGVKKNNSMGNDSLCIVQCPPYIIIKGRKGYNYNINGIYELQAVRHEGRASYKKSNTNCFIRYFPPNGQWLVDLKGNTFSLMENFFSGIPPPPPTTKKKGMFFSGLQVSGNRRFCTMCKLN